jgi:hypothetical protein
VRAVLLISVAGCQLAFPFESEQIVPGDCVFGFDEDGDGTDNCSDPCPHISAADDPAAAIDLDGDDIGEACDPSIATDRIVFFDGFDANAAYLDFRGARAEGTAIFADDTGFLIEGPFDRFRAEIGFRVTRQIGAVAGHGLAYGGVLAPPGGDRPYDGVYCHALTTPNGDLIELERFEGGRFAERDEGPADWASQGVNGLEGTMQLEATSGLRCAVDDGNATTTIAGDRPIPAGGLALFAFGVEVSVHYVLVIERGD